MILPITLTMAGAAALINIWLAIRTGRVRMSEKISIGDGGNARLTARMRAHANFTEYTPFVLILIGLIELADGTSMWLWAVGAFYMLARIAHGFGMDGVRGLREFGIGATLLILLGLGLYAVAIPHLAQRGAAGQTELVSTTAGNFTMPSLRVSVE
ncbi:MAG: GST-like protein [Sphingomonas sp. SCN 67-18]|uniref:MAPEG family protein n=1 Tax=uncultured Sphingomonas sp. TaxID=158754 RepID=UPI00086CDBA1|nr:MAPEG family protein [Sphingomonas sp. SCN 67-18]ODU20630.1 MAG: GST-like protein [Sphingomonas sp. SCN 67-18]